MKNKDNKFGLDNLKVQSFVTSLDNKKENTIKGGDGDPASEFAIDSYCERCSEKCFDDPGPDQTNEPGC